MVDVSQSDCSFIPFESFFEDTQRSKIVSLETFHGPYTILFIARKYFLLIRVPGLESIDLTLHT